MVGHAQEHKTRSDRSCGRARTRSRLSREAATLAGAFLLSFTAAAVAPSPTMAAGATGAATDEPRDFLLHVPRWSLTAKGGWHLASTSSDLFDFVTDELTIERGDFDGPSFGLDGAYFLTPHLDLALGVHYSRVSIFSENRDYVDQDGFPIEQRTRYNQVPVTVSLSYSPSGRGRAIGNYAWIPNRYALNFGAGAGATFYELEQAGDFVDFTDLSIFTDHFSSSGWAPTVHLFAGADLKLTPRLLLNLEARYAWADDELEGDFVGFEPIDLSGLRVTTGLRVLF